MSQPGNQIIAIQILLNISRSVVNQTMTFGQPIEYNMSKIFLGKSFTKCGGVVLSSFFKKTYPWINSLKFYTVCFYCMSG